MSTFDIGEVVDLDYTVKVNVNGTWTLTDATVALVVHAPDGTTSTLTPTHVTTGTYTANYVPLVAGTHRYRWTSSGAAQSAQDGNFDVRAAYSTVVTLADVHDHLNIPTTDTAHDGELQGFIDAATAVVVAEVGPLIPTSYTDTHQPNGSTVVLRQAPVVSVDSATAYASGAAVPLTLQSPGPPADTSGYSIDLTSGVMTVPRFSSGPATFVVTYTAGRQSIPADVRLAVLEDIRGLYQQTQQGGRIGGGSIGGEPDEQWNVGPMHLFPRLADLVASLDRGSSVA